jgi:hypothetical protein
VYLPGLPEPGLAMRPLSLERPFAERGRSIAGRERSDRERGKTVDAILSPISEDLGTEESPWSAWSFWESAKNWFDAGGLPLAGVWQSSRTKTHIHRDRVTEVSQTCVAVCPAGYSPSNGGCVGAVQHWTDSNGITYVSQSHASKTHVVDTRFAPPRIVENRWTETEWRFKFGSELNPGLVTAVENAPRERSGQALADITHGDQLHLGDGLEGWTVWINGEKHDPAQPLRSEHLALGDNYLELVKGTGEHAPRLQLHFGVAAPIELLPEAPVVEVQPTDERNGADIKLSLSNRSASEHAIRLDAVDSPLGWIGMLLGDRVRVLEAGASETVTLRVERLNPAASAEEWLPFGVCVRLLDGSKLERTAVVYVRPR